MAYKCYSCGKDITAEAEAAKNAGPTTVAHIVAKDPKTGKESDHVAEVFAVVCPYCTKTNVFPLRTTTFEFD